MRYPRILTCSSARPTYCSCPSAPQHTRSPVRYIRAPGSPNGHATNRDPVNPARRQYPHRHPGTGHIQLPDHPGRHRPQPPVQHKQRRPRHRRTDRHHPRPRCQRRTHRRIHRGLGRAVGVDHHPPRRPPIHHLGRAGLTGRPPTPPTPNPPVTTPPPPTGSGSSTLTCSATSKAWKSSGEPATDSGTTTSRPPCSSAPQISHTEKSKAIGMTLRPHLPRRQLQAGIQ